MGCMSSIFSSSIDLRLLKFSSMLLKDYINPELEVLKTVLKSLGSCECFMKPVVSSKATGVKGLS